MILLRNGKEEDIESIQQLADKTWPAAYGHIISTEQIKYMLEKMYNRGELLSQLQKGYTFLIAEENDKDLGFACFSIHDSANHIYKLHKLYVLPDAHGKGIGKLLINEVVNMVRKAGGKSLELNVNRDNKATQFYIRAGFTVKETMDLDIGNGFFMNDYVMEMAI
ncbi:MAG: GNAT family N-acetyltransferase [Candidatus Pedobacter colombiensis]|uniref:GNAT family N-acetyltransferase n=1 Tax=Candidatus Pedobacter colombiensis TaxID=3121371 RepID=A0AAJ5W8B4_9SPHI|nr:GNAT family N-acetyltransferase [Pedobacter sp.]WEK19430.1 MAG: GNAT family N-acetyltransferase [Pedobacter sp.]